MKYGLLAGMLIPWLILKHGNKFKAALPSIRGVVDTKHSIPGRIRLSVPNLVDNQTAAETLKTALVKIEPVKRVTADTVTGSVVMEYQVNSIEPLMLVGAVVRILGLDDVYGKQPSAVSKHVNTIMDSLDDTVRGISFGTLDVKAVVHVLLLSSIGYAVLKRRMFTLPDPTILSWWAYNHISGR